MTLLEQLNANSGRNSYYEGDLTPDLETPPAVRLIAFYLPQFYPIPENDTWWGKGFTEWTNVTKALPRFASHYQPRLPGELGFYDLRLPEVLFRQAALARKYGIYGFCFHHYWFNGKRLLERPLELLLDHPEIELPFCINWANESWTRRWDGYDKQILIAQMHSADDDIAFARSLEPLLSDRRYIRIDGRPLIMIYRPGLLPNPTATIDRWREFFTGAGLGNPFVVMPQAFGHDDPRLFNMDAAIGFPPFWAPATVKDRASLDLFDKNYKGVVISFEEMATLTVANRPSDFKFFPGVCPSWDNESRKTNWGSCFHGSTPKLYGRWLASACAHAMADEKPNKRIVFINAWNEWAEGAYLEPDRHFGYAYLAETARVLRSVQPSDSKLFTPATNSVYMGKSLLRRAVRKAARHGANLAEVVAQKLRE